MTGIIIQARMNSSRLPGKVLMKLGNKPLLEHIIHRLSFLKHPAKTIIATTATPADDAVEDYCTERGVACFRGSEENVLERYYLCAIEYSFDHIVRLTADNPFPDIEELDRLIDLHLSTGADYSHSITGLPIGAGAEIFTLSALERSYKMAARENHREHVNEYILEHPGNFNISVLSVTGDKNRPQVRLTVDTQEDYLKACWIINTAGSEYITTEKAVDLCSHFA